MRDDEKSVFKYISDEMQPFIVEQNNIDRKWDILGKDNYNQDPGFVDDGLKGRVTEIRFDPIHCVSIITAGEKIENGRQLLGRLLRLVQQWGVIKDCVEKKLTVWGDLRTHAQKELEFEIIPSYSID